MIPGQRPIRSQSLAQSGAAGQVIESENTVTGFGWVSIPSESNRSPNVVTEHSEHFVTKLGVLQKRPSIFCAEHKVEPNL